MNETFDLNEALEAIKAGAKIDGKDGVLSPMIKQLTEADNALKFPNIF